MPKADTSVIVGAASVPADVQVAGVNRLLTVGESAMTAVRIETGGAGGPAIRLMHSRNASGSADTIAQDGDSQGSLTWYGPDGASYRALGEIKGVVTGTPGSSDMPGALTFSTTPDGSATMAERFRIEPDGDLLQNATNGGNLVFTKDLTGIVDSTDSPAAAGSALADATVLTANVTFVTAADATKGVKFPAAPVGGVRFVIYNTANAVLKVWPGEATDNINANADGANVAVAAYGSLYCHASSADQWWCGEMANP